MRDEDRNRRPTKTRVLSLLVLEDERLTFGPALATQGVTEAILILPSSRPLNQRVRRQKTGHKLRFLFVFVLPPLYNVLNQVTIPKFVVRSVRSQRVR